MSRYERNVRLTPKPGSSSPLHHLPFCSVVTHLLGIMNPIQLQQYSRSPTIFICLLPKIAYQIKNGAPQFKLPYPILLVPRKSVILDSANFAMGDWFPHMHSLPPRPVAGFTAKLPQIYTHPSLFVDTSSQRSKLVIQPFSHTTR